MKFQLSTKPFANALDLGVIPANISKYYSPSCLAQLTASNRELRINLQASNVVTEILLKGSGDEDTTVTGFVDCLVLKQLVNTFDANTTTVEFGEGAITLHSGSSKFKLPYLADASENELTRPRLAPADAPKIPVDLNDWKFIKDHQMFAVALSFVHPVYTNAWIGQEGDVIVGDFDNSLFTFSKKSKLGQTCLLSDTIVNLFNSLPEGANITLMDKSYRVDVKTDGYEYATEFSPKYEDDGANGSYNSEVILGAAVKDMATAAKAAVAPISKFLSQADLLSSGGEHAINFSVAGNELRIYDKNIDCKVPIEGSCPEFNAQFVSSRFKSVIGHLDAESIMFCPVLADGEVSGLIIWTDSLTAMIGVVDEVAN